MHLWDAQVVCVCVELDPRECSELLVEKHLRKTAVDVRPAC